MKGKKVRIELKESVEKSADRLHIAANMFTETKYRIVRRNDPFSFDIERKTPKSSNNDYGTMAGMAFVRDSKAYLLVDFSREPAESIVLFAIPALFAILGIIGLFQKDYGLSGISLLTAILFSFVAFRPSGITHKEAILWISNILDGKS